MAHPETCILTNMCMIYDGDNILVQDRLNPNWPGIVFPGGHVEERESFVDSIIREVKEETGLTISNVKLCGLKQFQTENGAARYIVFMFKTNCFTGELKSSEEGKVFWINKNDIPKYQLANHFMEMLEVFLNDDLVESYYEYNNGNWTVTNK